MKLCWIALALVVGCGGKKSGSDPQPGSGTGSATVATSAADPAATKAAIDKLGAAWRADPKQDKPLVDLAALARDNAAWAAAVPYLAEGLTKTNAAIVPAFEALVALGPADPTVIPKLLGPITSDAKVLDYKQIWAAERTHGPSLKSVYLAAAKLADQPAIRISAFSELGRTGVVEARPILIAALKETPIVERDKNGGFSDPRTRVHSVAIRALEALGPDQASASAVLDVSQDMRLWDGDRYGAIESFWHMAPDPTPAQMALLLDHALRWKQHDDHEQAGTAYAMLSKTPAELDALAAAPPSEMPYYGGYDGLRAGVRRVLACERTPACLIALLESATTRQYDSSILERVELELARSPSPEVAGPLLEILDRLDRDGAESLVGWLPRMISGPCGTCADRVAAVAKRYEKDYFQSGDRIVDAFRRRGAGADTIVASSFVTPILALHDALAGKGGLAAARFAPTAFGFGTQASEVASGPEAVAALAANDFANQPAYQGIVKVKRGMQGKALWDAEIVIYEDGVFALMTQLIVETAGKHEIRAWSWSRSVSDGEATAALKANKLPKPAPVPDAPGDPELAAAAKAAFGSRDVWIRSLSERPDSASFGNDLGDEWDGSAQNKAFTAMGGSFKLHDGLHVEAVTADVGFAAANVDFAGKSGTRTYRVLAVFAKEPGGWKIVQSQWSLGLPIAGVR